MKTLFQFLFAAALLGLTACNSNTPNSKLTEAENQNDTTKNFSMQSKPYGMIGQDEIKQFIISNPSGMSVSIINYGGTITDIMTSDKNGKMGDVVLGFDSLSGYLQKNNPYFGALIGRYGNRIAKGKFSLDGKQYSLATNNNGNSLHGGLKGFDKVVWTAAALPGDSSLQLTYLSKDGEEGYPGQLSVKVVYSLSAKNELKIEYSATTTKPTPVNLTNHAYFNLSAGLDSTVLAHELMIDADKFTEVDGKLIPTGKLPVVKDGPMDFTKSKLIGRDLANVDGGYDHNWVLNKQGNDLTLAAKLYHPASGRNMEVWTTEPGLQFYSGNFLGETLTATRHGANYVLHGGLCLETQHFPDSPNQPSFPSTILLPGQTYHQLSIYKFGVQ